MYWVFDMPRINIRCSVFVEDELRWKRGHSLWTGYETREIYAPFCYIAQRLYVNEIRNDCGEDESEKCKGVKDWKLSLRAMWTLNDDRFTYPIEMLIGHSW